jgi:hypothetical protein
MTQNPIQCPAHNARHRQSIRQSWSFRRRQNPEFQQPVRAVKLRKPPYFERPISRMSNTGQSGAVLLEHWATVLASSRSSFFRPLSLARMSSR